MAMIFTSFLQPLSVQAEGEKNYSVVLPAGYDDDHSYPVVYVMPQNGLAQDNSGITEKLTAAMENGTATEMIIVKPSFTKESDVFAEMDAIIAEVDAEYNTIADADHRAVVGTGVGGYLAYILGLTEKVVIPSIEVKDVVVNTEVTVAGQYPTTIEVEVDDATALADAKASDFAVAGKSAGWLTSSLHDLQQHSKKYQLMVIK